MFVGMVNDSLFNLLFFPVCQLFFALIVGHLPDWHKSPEKPRSHTHLYELMPSIHKPLFWQGFGLQSSISGKKKLQKRKVCLIKSTLLVILQTTAI